MKWREAQVRGCQRRVGDEVGGEWRLERLLVVGRLAATYRAVDRAGASGDVSVLHPGLAGLTDIHTTFLTLAYRANEVNHAGIVRIRDYDYADDGCPYVVAEPLLVPSLENRLQRDASPWPAIEALTLADELLSIVEAIHAGGVYHREINPGNLHPDPDDPVRPLRLAGLGYGALAEARFCATLGVRPEASVLAYYAPEQRAKAWHEIGPATDIWAVGTLLFRLLTGRLPAPARVQLTAAPASLASWWPQAPAMLVELVDGALRVDSSERAGDAAAMRARIEACFEVAEVEGALWAVPPMLVDETPPPTGPPLDLSAASLSPASLSPASLSPTSLSPTSLSPTSLSPMFADAPPPDGVAPVSSDSSMAPPPISAESSLTDGSLADGSLADAPWSDGALLDASWSDGSLADVPWSAGALLDASWSDGSLPDASWSNGALPDIPLPDASWSGGPRPDAISPDAISPDAISPDANSPDANSPNAISPNALLPSLGTPAPSSSRLPVATLGVASATTPGPEPLEPALPPQPSPGSATLREDLVIDDALGARIVRGPAGAHLVAHGVAPGAVEAIRTFFSHIELAVVALVRHGAEHATVVHRIDSAAISATSMLASVAGPVGWRVAPYAFEVASVRGASRAGASCVVWAPTTPLDRVTHRLYADGVRGMAFSPGIERNELAAWLEAISADLGTSVAPADDSVTRLWAAALPHVTFEFLDAAGPGDYRGRLTWRRAKSRAVEALCISATTKLDACWQGSPTLGGESVMACWSRALARLASEPADAAVLADATRQRDEVAVRDARLRAVRVDGRRRTALGEQLRPESPWTSRRFTRVAAEALEVATQLGDLRAVARPMRAALDELTRSEVGSEPGTAIAFLGNLIPRVGSELVGAEAIEQIGVRLRQLVARGLVRPQAFGRMLGTPRPELDVVMAHLGPEVLDAALEALAREGGRTSLAERLLQFVQRVAPGSEARIGAALPRMSASAATVVVRLLAGSAAPAARDALARAREHGDPLVRIEAIGHLDGASSDQLRRAVRGLLEDDDPVARIEALRAMEARGIRPAGPHVMLRVRSPDFDSLPADEKRQLFHTLAALAPTRAEAVAIERLRTTVGGVRALMSSGPQASTGALCAEVLGCIGNSKSAHDALEALIARGWRVNRQVRAAAERALPRVAGRMTVRGSP